MLELQGKYASAKVFTDNIEQEAVSQIIQLLNQEFVCGAKVRIMPDTHAGAGCVIGFTANLGDKVIPNIVGVDIGCGMLTTCIGKWNNINLETLDKTVRKYIPSGMNSHTSPIVEIPSLIESLHCKNNLKNKEWLLNSLGTLGGGNHFIELNINSQQEYFLVIHSGSRNLGKQVAEIYQKLAIEQCKGAEDIGLLKQRLVEEYKRAGKQNEIQKLLKEIDAKYAHMHPKYPKELCFLTGELREKYLHDMLICQKYATMNRELMAELILTHWLGYKRNDFVSFETIHNYINPSDNIIRKGAISAYAGETVLIPMNMRDGSLICVGKGNCDWNYSAPHGAGRLMSRSKAKEVLSIQEYKEQMKGVYTTCVAKSTIDESPMAYKPMEEIVANIKDTVEIVDIIKPVYNFKASE